MERLHFVLAIVQVWLQIFGHTSENLSHSPCHPAFENQTACFAAVAGTSDLL
jgi:hypothetical protein